jgi:hypothetical protein
MGRWYQNGLTGEQVEVKTFEEEDALSPPWLRCSPPPSVSAPAKAPAEKKAAAPKKKAG